MQCLIISDSHYHEENIEKALKKCRGAEVVFYLGDGIRALGSVIDRHPEVAWFYVLGNCDRPTEIRGVPVGKVERVTLCGKRIVLTHGDLYGAKYGRGGLISLAKEEGADVVLYGHTHEPKEEYISERDLWLFNPGALEYSYGKGASCGVLTISEDGEILFSHGLL